MISTSLKKYVVLALAFLFLTSIASAVENFRVPVPHLRVYSQPSTLSAVIANLNGGQVVQAGSNPAGGFKKVLIVDSTGKKKIGYVALADLPGGSMITPSRSKPSSSRRSSSGDGLRGHWSFGLVGGVAYDTEAGRTITDSTGFQTTTASLSGIAPQFGAFVLIPWGQNVLLNGYLYYKSSSLAGTYTNSFGTSTAFTLTQSYVSAGLNLEWYLGKIPWWIGPTIQLDYGTTAAFAVGGATLPLSTNQFVGLFASTGYDIDLSDSIFMTPIIQIGGDLNASPIIIEGNFLVDFAYRF